MSTAPSSPSRESRATGSFGFDRPVRFPWRPEAGFARREAGTGRSVRHAEGGGRRGKHGFPRVPLAFGAVEGGSKRDVAIIGAALDLGQERRGVDMGPSAIRYAGLAERLVSLGLTVRDHGNVEAAVPEATALRDERARFLPEIKATCERIADAVAEEARAGATPLVLGGDHSVALGTLGGLASVHGEGGVL